MGYLDDNGLARLWKKIKNTFADTNHTHRNYNVFANDPFGLTEDKTSSANYKFLNHISDGKVKSSHRIAGGGGTTIITDDMNTDMFDGSITITSAGMNVGEVINDSKTMTIETGFSETPKMFRLYYATTDATTGATTINLAAECHPQLDAPFNLIVYNLPIGSITFNDGVATINWHTSTGLSCMWQAYI